MATGKWQALPGPLGMTVIVSGTGKGQIGANNTREVQTGLDHVGEQANKH